MQLIEPKIHLVPCFMFTLKQDGKLPFVPMEEEFILGVSKYGIKVSTMDQHVSAVLSKYIL